MVAFQRFCTGNMSQAASVNEKAPLGTAIPLKLAEPEVREVP